MVLRLGRFPFLAVALLAATAFVACNSDQPAAVEDASSGDGDVEEDIAIVEPDPIVVRVDATVPGDPATALTEGNAPLLVHLACDVGGEDAAGLSFSWTIDTQSPKLKELDWTFTSVGDREVCCTVTRPSFPDSKFKDCQFIRVRNMPALAISTPIINGTNEIGPGTCMDVSVSVTNTGGRVLDPFDVVCALSKKDTWDDASGADRIEIWRETIPKMADGKALPQTVDFANRQMCVPLETPKDGYYLLCKADDPDSFEEEDRKNNVQFAVSLVQVDPILGKKADLQVKSLGFQTGQTFPKSWNQSVGYSLVIENAGEGESTKFEYKVEVCPEGKPAGDALCSLVSSGTAATIYKMTPAQSLTIQRGWSVPPEQPDGRYCFHASVDVLETVEETDETNNVFATPACFEIKYTEEQGVDLDLISVKCTPPEAAWNGTLLVDFTVKNIGSAPSAKWKFDVLLSTGAAPTGATSRSLCADSPSACIIQDALAAGEERQTAPVVLKLSNELQLQEYFCFVKVDSDAKLDEIDESNNILKSDTKITISSKAVTDVYAKDITVSPTTQTAGQIINIEYTRGNNKLFTAAGVTVCAVLSANDTVSVSEINQKKDIVIASEVISEIRPDAKLTPEEQAAQKIVWPVVIPIELDHTLTTYKVGVLVDCKGLFSDDADKGNNGVVFKTTDLTVENAQGGCFDDDFEPNIDSAPKPLAAGVHEGLGLCDTGDAFVINVPAGNTLIVEVTARPVLWLTPIAPDFSLTLTNGEELIDERSSTATVPDAEQPEHQAYVAGYVVPETADYVVQIDPAKAINKAHYTINVRIVPPLDGIDLVPAQVVASPDITFSGGALHLDWKLVNLGDTPVGAFGVGVYLSSDAVFDAAVDRRVGLLAIPSLLAATSKPRHDILVLPTDLVGGPYTAFVRVDDANEVTELFEDNNVALAGAVEIDAANPCVDDTTYEPNNALNTATLLPSVAASYPTLGVCPDLEDWFAVELTAGQSLTATVEYKYVAKAGYLYVQIHDRNGVSALVEGTAPNKATGTLPYVWEAGTYYVRVFNPKKTAASLPYTYTLSLDVKAGLEKDACVGDVYEANNDSEHPSLTGCGLRKATLCLKDRDWYTFSLPAAVAVSVTLTNVGSDFKMRLFTDPTAKETVTKSGNGTLEITAPADAPQKYWLLLEPKTTTGIDSFDYELFFDGLPGVDLEVTAIAPATGAAYQGEDEVVSFTVANQCLDSVPTSQVGIYLSSDKTLDPADAVVRVGPLGGAIPAGGSYSTSQKFTVPLDVPAGMYTLFVTADPANAIVESNEGNNSGLSAFKVQQLCVDDGLEPNNTPTLAPALTSGTPNALQVCPFDVDWFKVALDGDETVTVTLDFAIASGDLDMRLYAAGNFTTPVSKAFETTDGETLVYSSAVPGTFYVRVNGLSGAANAYTMTAVVAGPPFCGDGACGTDEDCVLCAEDCGGMYCDDSDPCTENVCVPDAGAAEGYICLQPFAADGTPCNDGVVCSTPDACAAGICAGATGTCDACNFGPGEELFVVDVFATIAPSADPAYDAFDIDADPLTCSPSGCTGGNDNALAAFGAILDPIIAEGIADGTFGAAFWYTATPDPILSILRVMEDAAGIAVSPESFDDLCARRGDLVAVDNAGTLTAGGPGEEFVLVANLDDGPAAVVIRDVRVRAVPVLDGLTVTGWKGALGGIMSAANFAHVLYTAYPEFGTEEEIVGYLEPDIDSDGDGLAESLSVSFAFDATPVTVPSP